MRGEYTKETLLYQHSNFAKPSILVGLCFKGFAS